MKKYINETRIIMLLAIVNIVMVAGMLMEYKTERLIDTNASESIKYIYVRGE